MFAVNMTWGLSGVHPDKISCKHLQSLTVAQSATLLFALHRIGWQVASDDCNMIFERNVSATREGSPSVQLKQPATQILTPLLLQQRRWDRPLGTAHFATVKCQLMQQFVTIQVTKFAIRSVRWIQLSVCSSQTFWTFGGLPSHKLAGTKSQCSAADFADWNARLG